MSKKVTRRGFLKNASIAAAGVTLAACAPGATQSGGSDDPDNENQSGNVASAESPEEEVNTASGAQSQEEELYGMVVFLKGSEFFNWAYQGMVDAAARIGPHVKTELQGPAEWDASLEARAIDELAARGATGIVATAGDATAMDASINAAIEADIPVVLFDSDAPGSDRLCFASTDQYAAGYAAGEAMADWGVERVAISTFVGPDHLQRRVDGFTDALAEFAPDAEIVQIVNDEGRIEVAESQLTALLEANNDIDGIFASHGNPGPGAAAAVRTAGLEGQVQIMGFDFGLPVIELIESGEIRATVGQNPYLMGYTAMFIAYGAAVPTDVPDTNPGNIGHSINSNVDTGVAILTADDIEVYKTPPSF